MEGFLKEKLDERREKGLLRTLPESYRQIDFLSNDYLGLARNQQLRECIEERMTKEPFLLNGGTGSRLLSGNHEAYTALESYLAGIFQSEAALVFNSGYSANQSLISAVAGRGDTIIYDRLSHVCLKEGAWLSKAKSIAFTHNDVEDLQRKIAQAEGRVFVVTETVFSMDGDFSPIEDIIEVCEAEGAYLIVDEAHSTGVYGERGSGWLVACGLAHRVFARVYTFGKGMGVHGACVACSQVLKDFLINFGRGFIYTTSLPPHSVISIEESFLFLEQNQGLQDQLRDNIHAFRAVLKTPSDSAIQPVLIPGNKEVRQVASALQDMGFEVRPIVSPTVKEGSERLRICLHTYNKREDILALAENIQKRI